MRAEFAVWAREHQRRIEDVLLRALAFDDAVPSRLVAAMRYATLDGGKRMRPLLAYAAGEVVAADPSAVDAAAAAVEMIHAYSLAHDDLPCMDNDVLRRGKPTLHVAFGEAMALLAGDALQAQAFAVLQSAKLRDPALACALLAESAGARGMAGGQAVDLANVGAQLQMPELTAMHRMKTGAMIRAAVKLGAMCGTPLDEAQNLALDRFASAAGLAFQVVDDVLDVEGTAQTLGKTAGKDAAAGKPTYPALYGLEESRRMAAECVDRALAALETQSGLRDGHLPGIAQWVTRRTN